MSARILEGPKLQTKPPMKSLGQFFFEIAEANPDKICQVDGTADKSETYASVKQRSTRVALALQKRGVTSDDVIVFCSGNTLDTVIPITAALYIGAKVANVDITLSATQTRHLLSLVNPRMVFVEECAVHLIEESLKETELKPEIVVYGDSAKYDTLKLLLEPQDGEGEFRPVAVDPHQVAWMFFSSGTTGMPKAICHSHYTFLVNGCSLNDYGLGAATMHPTSFYWITASLMLLSAYFKAGLRAFVRVFEPAVVLRTIEKYKVESLFVSPILLNKLLNFAHARDYDTSSLRVLHVGGDTVRPAQIEKASQLFKHTHVMVIYGMSEVGCISMFDPKTDQELIKTKRSSCGKPTYGIRIKFVDSNTNKLLPPNQEGELHIHYPGIMVGYHNADSSKEYDEDGFIKSGDIGYYDEDGCIYIIERVKEMFKYQSWHIVPSTIETVLIQHPAVKEAAVVGVPAGDDGQMPAACVVLNQPATKAEISEFVEKRLSDREKLRGGVYFVDSLAKTPSGKLIRKEIRNSILGK